MPKQEPARPETSDAQPRSLALSGGRTLVVRGARAGEESESLELRSSDGALELSITMTPDGPRIHVRGGTLSVQAADAVSVACRRFEIAATDSIRLETRDVSIAAAGDVGVRTLGELRLKSLGETHVDGEMIHLNGGDRSEYPPPPQFVMSDEQYREVYGTNAELAKRLSSGQGAGGAGGAGGAEGANASPTASRDAASQGSCGCAAGGPCGHGPGGAGGASAGGA